MSKNFTESEARALVGKRIRTLTTWSGVEAGTTGTVTRADPAGRTHEGTAYDVAITWDLPTDPPAVWSGKVEGEPVVAIRTGKPLTDWFSKSEYERWIEELD